MSDIELVRSRIDCYKKMLCLDMCPFQKNAINQMLKYELYLIKSLKNLGYNTRQLKELTLNELASYDGSHGKPAYVAVNGNVYDVSVQPTWGGGTHFGLISGTDLTTQFNSCHDMVEILNKLPKVGIIKK